MFSGVYIKKKHDWLCCYRKLVNALANIVNCFPNRRKFPVWMLPAPVGHTSASIIPLIKVGRGMYSVMHLDSGVTRFFVCQIYSNEGSKFVKIRSPFLVSATLNTNHVSYCTHKQSPIKILLKSCTTEQRRHDWKLFRVIDLIEIITSIWLNFSPVPRSLITFRCHSGCLRALRV